ncbi:SusC/RagA family TonB-linked outer membrane protein [Agriterribacter sp.]|uniref:SusC/RagA family TonB-linked outer membrane protein n=1 Tax=Agriterribacter sp. TaxID=2821509 RepID=UPI002CC5D85D|nr:SusC/RagA family TonB-linked outer membrane protein [Agriterribacter sp.]HRO46716.1 SusC/RagA family TonB-linked outer membrane protein [Agriterribacter sp.]HRQ18904.1 SusC/RagA family TonB-linked outer membrane protein [Agriterribacter sp.]
MQFDTFRGKLCAYLGKNRFTGFLNKARLIKTGLPVSKLIMQMKLISFLLFVICMQASASLSAQKITLSEKNASIQKILREIRRQSDFDFLVNARTLKSVQLLDISVKEMPLEHVLKLVFEHLPLDYVVDNKTIIIRDKTDHPGMEIQELKVSGIIINDRGEPLAGASIIEKGTSNGVTSNENGRFSITVKNESAVLQITSVGYISKEVRVTSGELTVMLEADNSSMTDVVVVGYGVQKKSDITGALSSVKGGDLTKLPTQRVDQALQGRAAGVMVQNTDGAPGGNAMIRVRGGNSITGGNNALVVVDGIQGVNISTINPNDVESLEVLKDASATAIYGARGANGVILITTKRGAAGRPAFHYGFNIGSQRLNHKLSLLSAGDYARKSNDYAAMQDGTPGAPVTPVLPFTEKQIDDLYKSGGTDWQDEVYRAGLIQNHQLSISGGSDNTRYFVSGGYMDQQGIVIGTKYKRYNIRSNLDLKFNSWITAGVNLHVIKDEGNVPPVGEGTRFGDILGQVINTVGRFDPVTPVYSADGSYNYKALRGGPDGTKSYADQDVWNPVATALETRSQKNNIINEISTFLDFKLLEELTFRVTGAASVTSNDQQYFYNTKTQPGFGVSGLGNLTESKYQYFQNSNILTYNKTFGKHQLTVTGVAEQQYIRSKELFIAAQGFFSDETGINDLGGAGQINEKTSFLAKQTLNSYLGRINYVLANRYMFTASYRADGSSVFGANNKWGYFPSGAVAWRAAEEDFIKALAVFSELKLRASWGKTGNQAIGPYQSLATVMSGYNYPYDGNGVANIGFALGRPANPDLKWETTTQTNFGIDAGFFEDRLTLTADIYKKVTKDLLLNKQIEAYTGFSTMLANVGSIQNKGLEIAVGGRPISGTDFKWNTGFNISFNRSKVLALLDDQPLAIRTNTGGGYQIYGSGFSVKYLQVGQPVDQMRGYVNLGTWSEAEREAAKDMGQAPGEAKWKDVNSDGRITRAADGNEVIGNASPKFIYGWNNNITYKDFDLTFLIQGSYGNDIFNAVRIKTENPAVGLSTNLNNRWTADNQNTDVPVFLSSMERNLLDLGPNQTSGIGVDQRSSRWVEDGSYIRMKNVTLTYNFPYTLLRRIRINRLSAYVTAVNLFTITKYTGYDPEVSSFNAGGAGGLGIDLSNYPTSKTFIFGINLSF